MKKVNCLSIALAAGLLAFTGCKQKAEVTVGTTAEKAVLAAAECDIQISNIHFTKAINGAEKLVSVNDGQTIFKAGAKTDFFSDPKGTSTATSPILMTAVDNTKPFSFSAKVTPGFTAEGTYNAAVLYLFSDSAHYQKLCFEQDERGKHRVVTVRTKGTSDDNNHDIAADKSVYLKIVSDTKTVVSYYSTDKINWQMVRLYQNDYPKKIWLGISSQCPMGEGNESIFEDLELRSEFPADLRIGK